MIECAPVLMKNHGSFAFFGSGLDTVIDAQRAAYQTCLAAGGLDCRLGFDVYALATPRLVAASFLFRVSC